MFGQVLIYIYIYIISDCITCNSCNDFFSKLSELFSILICVYLIGII